MSLVSGAYGSDGEEEQHDEEEDLWKDDKPLEVRPLPPREDSESDDERDHEEDAERAAYQRDKPKPSLLPPPDEVFAQVTGPPSFLDPPATRKLADVAGRPLPPSAIAAAENAYSKAESNARKRANPGMLLFFAVVQAKAKLRTFAVDDDIDGPNVPLPAALAAKIVEKQLEGAVYGNKPKEDKGTVKDKEKVKRMKGQSSIATWKTEEEMRLRQQFD
eukprot:jgi/Chlat1/6896/Chrsp52S06581